MAMALARRAASAWAPVTSRSLLWAPAQHAHGLQPPRAAHTQQQQQRQQPPHQHLQQQGHPIQQQVRWKSARAQKVEAQAASPASRVKNEDPSKRKVFVQKFGGTSLGTFEKLEKVVNIVRTNLEKARLACVVSAISSETKSEGTTSRLLNAAQAAVNEDPFHHFLDAIEDTHLDIIYSMIRNPDNRDAAKQHVLKELRNVRQFCESLTVIRELSPRSHDMIVGCGERLSAGMIASVLKEEGIPTVYMNLSHLFKSPLDANKVGYHHKAIAALQTQLDKTVDLDYVVPIITGYMGDIAGGIIDGIGRGYSDLTAALVAAALKADALQVWKESDGIFTGNPTKISNAQLLHVVSPREAAELTYFGNEVLHPFTMECAIEANIPIHILNTFKIDSPGTVVKPHATQTELAERGLRNIAAVVSKKHIDVINVASNKRLESASFLAKVFELFAKHRVKVDLISTSETNLSITVHESVEGHRVQDLVAELEALGRCSIKRNRAIVSIIGEGMAKQIGLAAEMMDCLSSQKINFEMITQGASEINTTVVIKQDQADLAVQAIHERFLDASKK
ncbi:aspartokinase [Salpingoeca rosetta]|uniref:aspartate kinase n=1 Tax=Salpingoeca rosetta (strain ATCC 50818 / BSB-021) TaxID=946362 RepID=F2TXK7_SALR5|nr:aspartokinase [Salpingoeca rosetta]EGD76116.1 aspartokinase [Salpingoeca rosetta]|eukprot:XP_004998291.1 aspartokinase [Salpingoeca rosetta]